MIAFILAFFSGDLFLQAFSQLPTKTNVYIFVFLGILIWVLLRKRWSYAYLLLAFILGFSWTFWQADSILSWTLPKELEGRPLLITGRISSLPVNTTFGTYFEFTVLSEKKAPRVRLMWRDSKQHLRVGDKRQFLVRMKRIHGTQSPGAFDFEAWAVQKGLRATGYVLVSDKNSLLAHDWYYHPIDQLRQNLQEKIQNHLPVTPTAHWLIALTLGERNDVSQSDWQILRNTGTNHLMAIAGLHIGMMAGVMHIITAWLWRRSSKLVLWLPAMHAGAYAALITALAYGALAGFSLPTQRACIMLVVYIIALLSRRKINAWHSWSLALAFVLLLNPLNVLTESFWLSFSTIALIIYGMNGRLAPEGLWWKWGRVQWVIGIGLIPLSLELFQETSLISFVANSIAIPWLGFLILPLCLLGAFFVLSVPTIGGFFLFLADKSLSALWLILTWLSRLDISSWQYAFPNKFILLIAIIGCLFLLLPASFPGRWAAIIWFMPMLLWKPDKPASGDVWLSLLDVGQGLSVVVQTANHILVYDTGPKFSDNLDMGESVVLPYLRSIARKKIDMLVISHGDNDHIGGANAIIRTLPVMSVYSSVPEKLPSTMTHFCIAGLTWQWDGVNFSFLYPTQNNLNLTNDSSCVLQIDDNGQRILLTGDIEKYAESDLLNRVPDKLAAQIMIAPHHGSKTSGLPKFIAAVHPQFVLYATGYKNRYHFPHHSIVNAYQEINAIQINTSETGTIVFKIKKGRTLSSPELYRQINKRYWKDIAY